MNEYYKKFTAMKVINETLNNNIHDDLGFAKVIVREEGKDLTAMALPDRKPFEADAYASGRDCMMAIHFYMMQTTRLLVVSAMIFAATIS